MSQLTAKACGYYTCAKNVLSQADGLAPLFIRLILAPTFIIAGYNKLRLGDESAGFFASLGPDANVAAWFGNADWGLGLPMPELMTFLAGWAEFGGGWLILLGLATRLISIPLLFTMFIAMSTAHLENGWFAIASSNPDTSAAQVLDWVGIPGAAASLENSEEVSRRLSKAKSVLKEHANYSWITQKGGIAVLNNGIEFAATYFAMLLVLLFWGGGRYVSLDYWLRRRCEKQCSRA